MIKSTFIQLGKQGLTPNFFENLETQFKKNRLIKISVLKSAGHEKKIVKEYSDKILEKLGPHYTAKIIGFTIAVKKWRKAKR